jgi:hypothetical protein
MTTTTCRCGAVVVWARTEARRDPVALEAAEPGNVVLLEDCHPTDPPTPLARFVTAPQLMVDGDEDAVVVGTGGTHVLHRTRCTDAHPQPQET